MGETCAVPGPSPSQKAALELLAEVVSEHANAEDRPQQHEMAKLVAAAVATGEPLIVQAGTGTGKSLAYLCAAVGTGTSVVVSTATRQLSDQLVNSDVPLVAQAVRSLQGRELSAVSLKGRANYLCLAKVDELHRLDARANESTPPPEQVEELDLGIEVPQPVAESAKPHRPTSADLRALNELLEWADAGPKSGDRVDAPTVPDRVWAQVSTDTAGCPGARVCAFGNDCFTELARARARVADVVVVNHALLAQDLISPNPLFDDRELIVIDEVHELVDYLSSAWGAEIFAGSIDRIVTNAARRAPKSRQTVVDKAFSAVGDASIVAQELMALPAQRWEGELPPSLAGPLESLERRANELAKSFDEIVREAGPDGGDASTAALQSARGQLQELATAINLVRTPNDAFVRWSAIERDGGATVLRAAPLSVGRTFRDRIGTRALVATSATACVAGDFAPLAESMGLVNPSALTPDSEPRATTWQGVDVGSPFDYQKQAILYIPDDIPEPVGKERAEHTAAVLDELTELVAAAGGRTLALFTTTVAARNAADHLRQKTNHVILEHGELPPAVLAQEFADDETSVLCATMGMWAGLNVVGPACTLVVIDKIPFAPMDDPLSAARRVNVDARGGNGFKEVFVNHAALMLTQGAGRLVRHRDDRGVVAILDPRIHTRGYGQLITRTLPPMWRTTDRDLVLAALRRLAEAQAKA